MKKVLTKYKNKQGQILIISVIFLTVVMILVTSMFTRTAGFLLFGTKDVGDQQAQGLAEAGVDYALWQLNLTAGAFTGSPTTEVVVGETGSFTVTVVNKSANLKTVTAVGYIPNRTDPKYQRTVKVDSVVDNDIVAFNYAIQVGTGGVNLGQSARINGSVYSNKSGAGSISGNQSSVITGNTWSVGTVTTPNPNVIGIKYQNQQPSTMPSLDYQQWKDTATAGGIIDCAQTPSLCNLTGSGTATIGNKKYLGDLSLGQSKNVVLNGPIYVTGNINLGQSSIISLDSSFGSNSTVIITDGIVDVGQSAQINPTNAIPKGYILLATTSTASTAIDIHQSGANAIFYALEGGVNLGQSARATAIIAKTLSLGQSTILTYDQGLASTELSDGPGGAWVPKKGTYKLR